MLVEGLEPCARHVYLLCSAQRTVRPQSFFCHFHHQYYKKYPSEKKGGIHPREKHGDKRPVNNNFSLGEQLESELF